jgi:hypothetical protein
MASMAQRALEDALELGFESPLVMVVVGAGAELLAMKYQGRGEALEATLLVETESDSPMTYPINLLVTDARGEVLRVLVRRGEVEIDHLSDSVAAAN